MMWTQIKAFSLLLVVLLTVDAIKFHGEYRTLAAEKMARIAHNMPRHFTGLGPGRDWSQRR